MTFRTEQEVRLSKHREGQDSSHPVATAVQERGLAFRRPERRPGRRRRAEDDLLERVLIEWVSKVRWRKYWTGF